MVPCPALLLGLRNEVLDAVHPSQSVRHYRLNSDDKTHTIVPLRCSSASVQGVHVQQQTQTHLDPALIGTASFTRSERGFPEDADSFFPPMDAKTAPPVAKSVPNVRYSVLMARPKMTLPIQRSVKW